MNRKVGLYPHQCPFKGRKMFKEATSEKLCAGKQMIRAQSEPVAPADEGSPTAILSSLKEVTKS